MVEERRAFRLPRLGDSWKESYEFAARFRNSGIFESPAMRASRSFALSLASLWRPNTL